MSAQPIYGRQNISFLTELEIILSREFYKHCAATRLRIGATSMRPNAGKSNASC